MACGAKVAVSIIRKGGGKMVLQLRVDERLAHGQVCTTWINALGATHIIIANNAVANDALQKKIMGMGIPSTVKSMFATLDKAAELLNNPKSEFLKIFLVVQSPKDALYILERTDGIKEVNIANYGQLVKSGKEIAVKVNSMLLLDEDDVEAVKGIQSVVKSVFFQDIVGHPKQSIKL